MTDEAPVIFSREWAVTMALVALLTPVYTRPVTAVYGLTQLTRVLRDRPRAPVLLGLRPHEHVAELYRLQPMLSGRAVLFVGRYFYWTDYSLPEYFGLARYMFCSWDTLHSPFSRRVELRHFIQMSADRKGDNVHADAEAPVALDMTEARMIEKANRWLYRALTATGLTGYEIRVLSLMTEGRKGNLPPRTRSLHKNNGLYKLGMTKHVMDLYRGVKVRPVLQAGLPLLAEDVTEINGLLRQGAGR
ncbi:hypothetical protein S828_24185 [Salmonella enterica]|nr:hypothetical protein [Salmonella enterica]